MKTIKITLARNKENELYKRKHYWLVLNAPIVVDFNAPDDTGKCDFHGFFIGRPHFICFLLKTNMIAPTTNHVIHPCRKDTEIYENQIPAHYKPRYEPRRRWPVGSPCAAPQVEIKGRPGVRLQLIVTFLDGDQRLPVVELQEVA